VEKLAFRYKAPSLQ